MTTATATGLRTLAFGDLETGLWGVALAGPQSFLAFGAPGANHIVWSVEVEDSSADEWSLSGDGFELAVAPLGQHEAPDAAGSDELCRVKGRLELDGSWHDVDCLGSRGVGAAAPELQQLGAFRQISAWFDAHDGIVVTALRPAGKRGHGDDVLTVALFDSEGPVAVSDPRLSTTYTAEGQPSRVSLELWLELDEDSEQQFPRRAAGETVGSGAAFENEALSVRAELLRFHSRGLEGPALYLLVQPR
jgi:hypothetical protein